VDACSRDPLPEPRPPVSPSTPDLEFEQVLATCLEQMERDGSAALHAICASHPRLAERLRRRVSLLVAANLLDLGPSLERLPERLGDFEPLERLGVGGMGVVHRARQVSTGRDVALKLVRPEQLVFPESRARFRREVELSARMHHPSILPVLAVGETDGLPWFAMELVRGTSLSALLVELRRRFPDPARIDPSLLPEIVRGLTPESLREDSGFQAGPSWRAWSLGAARAVALALAYAHGRGVLHRDVKPSNVLVAIDGRIFLSDLGLASDPGESSLTRSSSAVGSLPYMAPEVLEGEPADARSDVYGVGALLYELLTLHRPFEAGSAASLMRAILSGSPTPPRRHLPRLGADDEAVLLRALAHEPARRYATAAELVEDLDHLLARRPTRARPAGVFLRALRFAQRRPASATAVGLGALVLLAGPLGWELNRMRTLRAVQEAYDKEREARTTSERHFRSALSAIGHVLRDTATHELEDVPRMQRARLVAIDRALELLSELERDRPDDSDVAAERTQLFLSRAQVLYDLGRLDEAVDEYERSIAAERALSGRDAPASARRNRADTLLLALRGKAKVLQACLRYSEALDLQREIVRLTRGRCAADPEDAGGKRDLAIALADLAESHRVVQGPAPARPLLEEGYQVARELAAAAPAEAAFAWAFGRLARDRGELELELGDDELAWRLVTQGLEALRVASALAPEKRFYQFDVATALVVLAEVELARGDLGRAESGYREALALLDALVQDFPDSTRYRRERANAKDLLAIALGNSQGRFHDAAELQEEVVAELEALLAAQPSRCDLRSRTALAAGNLANSLNNARERVERALELAERGLELLEPCRGLETYPIAIPMQELLLRYQRALALCFLDDLVAAHEAIEAFGAGVGDDARMVRFVSDLWNEWILALRRVEPASELRDELELEPRARMYETLRRAIDLGYRNLEELRTTPALDPFRGDPELVEILETIGG